MALMGFYVHKICIYLRKTKQINIICLCPTTYVYICMFAYKYLLTNLDIHYSYFYIFMIVSYMCILSYRKQSYHIVKTKYVAS